jgi:predicted outer membrane repeat protein
MASKISQLFGLGFLVFASTALAGTTHEITETTNTQNAIQAKLASESASNGDVLVFSSEGPYIFSGSVSTDRNLALRGASVMAGQPPSTILKKTTESRFFDFSADCGGTESGIKNLQFIDENGLVIDGCGGAIFVGGNLLGGIENSIFAGNYSTGPGGAVFAASFSGDIVNSSFFGNFGDSGGAVLADDFSGNIKDSIFFRNSAVQLGGALFMGISMRRSTESFCDFGGSKFLSNSSVGKGGAIAIATNCYLGALSGDVIFQGNKNIRPTEKVARGYSIQNQRRLRTDFILLD